MNNLINEKCKPCEGLGEILEESEIIKNLSEISNWEYDRTKKTLHRQFIMKNFLAAVEFINSIAAVAEEENHHPDFTLRSYRKLRIELSTHALKGVTKNDLIMAAKINALPVKLKASN